MASSKQPRLKAFGMEFFGEAKTATFEVWWYEEPQRDGSIKRIALLPMEYEPGGDYDRRTTD